jgi:hypothetical protein
MIEQSPGQDPHDPADVPDPGHPEPATPTDPYPVSDPIIEPDGIPQPFPTPPEPIPTYPPDVTF